MTHTEPISLPRRDFLRGAACALGAVCALGLEATGTQAAPASDAPALSVAFWTGKRLVDARHLPACGPSLFPSGARLTVHAHGGGEGLRAINAHFPVMLGGEERHVPFHAWTAAAPAHAEARFVMPVPPGAGLLLSALHEETETFVRLRADAAPGQPGLQPGLYVLALGHPSWPGYHLETEALRAPSGPLSRRSLGGFVPARFGYRVLSVERA